MPGPSRAETLLPLADDELIVGWRNSEWTGHRAVPRGGRRVLVDRAERDRPRARALRARRRGARHDGRRARVRPRARRVPLRAARPAPPDGLGGDDRAPRALRDGRRDPDRGALVIGRPRRRGHRRPHRPRGGLPPDARRDVARAAARLRRRSCAARGGARRALALRARRARRGPAARSSDAGSRSGSAERSRTSRPVVRGTHEPELAELLDEMTSVRRTAPAGARW